jgi:hypothetical protein
VWHRSWHNGSGAQKMFFEGMTDTNHEKDFPE